MSDRTVLFLCPYGGAKSVIAASLFNREARLSSLPLVATAAAADVPYDAVPEAVAELLAADGIDVRGVRPRRVTEEDVRAASRVIAIDCDLAGVDTRGAAVERWDDVPKVSEDLRGSAAAIRRHVEELIRSERNRS